MIYIHALFVNCHFQVTSEQEDYARPFVDLLKNMHQTKNGQQQQQSQITPKISTTEYYTTGSGAIVANPVITTSAPAMSAPHASTIFCTVGMSGGSVTYTDIGKNKFFSSIFFQFFFLQMKIFVRFDQCRLADRLSIARSTFCMSLFFNSS